MTLTFDLQGYHHILCASVDYVGIYVKLMLHDQYLESCGDLNAFAVWIGIYSLTPYSDKSNVRIILYNSKQLEKTG